MAETPPSVTSVHHPHAVYPSRDLAILACIEAAEGTGPKKQVFILTTSIRWEYITRALRRMKAQGLIESTGGNGAASNWWLTHAGAKRLDLSVAVAVSDNGHRWECYGASGKSADDCMAMARALIEDESATVILEPLDLGNPDKRFQTSQGNLPTSRKDWKNAGQIGIGL